MDRKTLCLFALATFLGSTRSELIMSVLPEEVIPGITPTFTLRCTAGEVEPAVVSLQIKRATQGSSRHIYQTLATLNATAMNSSVVTSGLPGMTAHGMLGRIGFEVLPFLEVTMRNPSVKDLGTYVCDGMMMGEMGPVPLSSFISVTTSDPVSDRLLHLLFMLRTQLQSMTGQMSSLQTELSHLHQQGTGKPQGERPSESGHGGGGRDLPDATIIHIHEYDNTSYVLWRSARPIVVDEALESCSSAGMYLTEINNEAEFRQVVQGIGAHVPTRSSLLLGGQRVDQWLWPHSGSMIDYMRGIDSTRRAACLAMKKVSDYRMVMDVVNCDDRFRYYLCSVDEAILN